MKANQGMWGNKGHPDEAGSERERKRSKLSLRLIRAQSQDCYELQRQDPSPLRGTLASSLRSPAEGEGHEGFPPPPAAQGAPRDPRRDSRGERSPWLPLETRPDSPGEPGMQPRHRHKSREPWVFCHDSRKTSRVLQNVLSRDGYLLEPTVPGSPGESDLVSRGSQGLRSPLESRRGSLGAP